MHIKRIYNVIIGVVAVGIVASVIIGVSYANSSAWQNRKYDKGLDNSVIVQSITTTYKSKESVKNIESEITTTATTTAPILIYSDSSESSEEEEVKETTTTKETSLTTTPKNVETTITSEEIVATTTTIIETTIPETTTTTTTIEEEYNNYSGLFYTDYEIELLAMLINHEASASWEGRVYVGSVVVNRMYYFDTSVTNVIYMPNQFTYDLYYYTDDDYQAAKYVLENGSIDNRLFYYTGNHYDGLNWFEDIDRNFIVAK